MKHSTAATVFVLLFCALFLSACSSQRSELAKSPADNSSLGGGASQDGGYYGAAEDEAYKNTLGNASDAAALTAYERKTIRDLWMDLESADAIALYEQMNAYAAALGGYEFSNNVQRKETLTLISVVWKVPPERLDEFTRFAGENGTVISSRLSSEDITDSYYDTQTRLDTLRKTLTQYYELLSHANTMEDIVYVQRIIDGIVSDIEAYEGKVRMWDQLTGMATVTVTITQESSPMEERREIDWSALSLEDMGYLIRSGAVAVGSRVVTVLQWLIIVLAVGSPLWLALGLILFFAVRRRRRMRASLPKEEASREDAET